jgi:hypothetical protein
MTIRPSPGRASERGRPSGLSEARLMAKYSYKVGATGSRTGTSAVTWHRDDPAAPTV